MKNSGRFISAFLVAVVYFALFGGGHAVLAAVEDCPADTVQPKPVFTNPPSPNSGQNTTSQNSTTSPLTIAGTSCPPLPDKVNYKPANNSCVGACSKWVSVGYSWNGGYTTITPTTGPVTCIGHPAQIIDKIISTPSQGSQWSSLDPMLPAVGNVNGGGVIEDRHWQPVNSARIWRFRTPSQEGTVLTFYGSEAGGSYNCCTTYNVSRTPCDTTMGIGTTPMFGAISSGGANGWGTTGIGGLSYLVKKNAPADGSHVKCGPNSQGLWAASGMPQLEPDTVYYFTVLLENNKLPWDTLVSNVWGVRITPPGPKGPACNPPANPVPAVCP